MPPFPGEETLTTVYADVHTYFDAPAPRPFLHRFDRASYFYIYYNSTRQTSRIELALHPGTADQSAFNGFLDHVKITHSHRFPTRLTLTVDGSDLTTASASPSSAQPGRDPDEWRLASADPRDPGTNKYRIHTVDFYFWTHDDATLVLDIFKRLLEACQLDIDAVPTAAPAPRHDDVVSPVVQKLEHVAIADATYNAAEHNAAAQPKATQLPPPPTNLPAHKATSPSPGAVSANVNEASALPAPPAAATNAPAASFTPLAYNPAAPAAPEPIAHREDTPPPVDAVDGTGLAAAAAHDQAYGRPHPSHAYPGAPGPPTAPYGHQGSPPQPSFGPQAASGIQQPSSASQLSSYQPGLTSNFAPPPTNTNTSPDGGRRPSAAAQAYVPAHDPNAHIFGQSPVQTPGSQFYQSLDPPNHPHKPLQHVQPQYPDYLAAEQAPPPLAPQPPVGGYSSYQYGQPPQATGPGGGYDIHSQVYRPTEDEQHAHHHHSRPSRSSGSSHKPSQTERLEKGVGKLFKKIEKKIG